jgi:hypothetical protein
MKIGVCEMKDIVLYGFKHMGRWVFSEANVKNPLSTHYIQVNPTAFMRLSVDRRVSLYRERLLDEEAKREDNFKENQNDT